MKPEYAITQTRLEFATTQATFDHEGDHAVPCPSPIPPEGDGWQLTCSTITRGSYHEERTVFWFWSREVASGEVKP